MKILSYKNRFMLIWGVLFNPTRFVVRIKADKDLALMREREKLQSNFTEKVNMLVREQTYSGIAARNHRSMPVLRVPITRHSTRATDIAGANLGMSSCTTELNSTVIPVVMDTQYSDINLRARSIKEEAAKSIAATLVNEGFLNTHIENNKITFSIHAYR